MTFFVLKKITKLKLKMRLFNTLLTAEPLPNNPILSCA